MGLLNETEQGRHLLKATTNRTPAEEGSACYWAPAPCTALRSALITRGHLRWSTFTHDAVTEYSRRHLYAFGLPGCCRDPAPGRRHG